MEGQLNLVEMLQSMGPAAMVVAAVLFIMSFWSVGVAIERIFTFNKAKAQSKLYAPQVAKHLKEGRLKEAIAVSQAKEYRYSHLAKVVLAGLQEYQFQTESGGNLSREDLLDTVRRSIQRATALTSSDLKKGVSALATIGSTASAPATLSTAGPCTSGMARPARSMAEPMPSRSTDVTPRARAISSRLNPRPSRRWPGGTLKRIPAFAGMPSPLHRQGLGVVLKSGTNHRQGLRPSPPRSLVCHRLIGC